MSKNRTEPLFVIHGTLHMQGWLWKQKSKLQASKLGITTKWTRRWVVLDDKAIYWFKNEAVCACVCHPLDLFFSNMLNQIAIHFYFRSMFLIRILIVLCFVGRGDLMVWLTDSKTSGNHSFKIISYL
jgi:hypothetical protein